MLEALAEHVGAGHGRDAPVLADLTVTRRGSGRCEPGVGAAVAGGPDDRADAGGVEVERVGDRRRRSPAAIGSASSTSAVRPSRSMASSMRARTRAVWRSAAVDDGAAGRWPSVTRVSVDAVQPADEADAVAPAAWRGRGCGDRCGPTSCSDGSVRAAATSPTSSMVLSNAPIRSSHQKMSMPR